MKTSKDNTEIECPQCGRMVPKWSMKQHKKDEHVRPVHENYVEFREQILKESKDFRKGLYKERFFPLAPPPTKPDAEPTMWIMGHSHVPAASVSYIVQGSIIRHDSFPGYARLDRKQRYPFSGQREVYDAIVASKVPTKQGVHFLWVPLWVEKAISTYRDNDGFAGLSLSEFISRTLGQDGSSVESSNPL